MVDNIVWEKVKGHSHVLIPIKWGFEVHILNVGSGELGSGVLMTLFHMIFDDSMLAVRVVNLKGYLIRFPPTVMQTR